MRLESWQQVTRLFRRRYRWIWVGGWTWIRIRDLTEAEMTFAEASIATADGLSVDALMNARRLLLSWCIVDGDGERMFDTDEKMGMLGGLNGRMAHRLFNACRSHCGYKDCDIDELMKLSDFFREMKDVQLPDRDQGVDDVAKQWVAAGRQRKNGRH